MSLLRDVRLAIRGFAKNPGFTVLAVLALALGIGASTLMFSVVDNVVLNPFPYADQHRLMGIEIRDMVGAAYANQSFFTTQQFLDYAERNHVFDSVIGRSFDDMLYRTDTGTEQFDGGVVTPNTFQFLGVPALLGRVIVPDDGKPDAPPVFVMRYKLWVERFHSDPSILNQTFVLNGVQRTLIGIMPRRFAWGNMDMWIPKMVSRSSPDAQDQSRYYQLLGHLKPEVSRSQADADLGLLSRQLAPLYPKDYPSRFRVRSASYAEMVTGDFRTMLFIMLAAVGLVLLIACGNVANLLLARAIAREKEFAIQAAMGATRSKVVQRLMLESLLLAIAGAGVGWGFGWAGLKIVMSWMPRQAVPPSAVVSLDGNVLLFTIGVTLLTVFIFGLAPALQVSRRDTISALRDTGKGVSGGFRHGRLRDIIVTGWTQPRIRDRERRPEPGVGPRDGCAGRETNAICSAIRGQPQLGFRRFISRTSSISSLVEPLGPGRTPAPRRKQQARFPLRQHIVKMQERRRLEHDGGAQQTCPVDEEHTQAGHDPVGGAQVRRSFAATVQDQQPVSHENGLGDDAPVSSGLDQAHDRDDQMKQKDQEIAHLGNRTKVPRSSDFRCKLAIRQGQLYWIGFLHSEVLRHYSSGRAG